MGENSKIEWTDASWTPIRAKRKPSAAQVGDVGWRSALPGGKPGWHCEHASEGCRNCYAESMNRRLGTGLDFKPGHRSDIEIYLDEKMLLAPLRWHAPRLIFVCSMTDAFASFVKDEWLDRMFAVMALCPQHTFQVLTKRAERMRDYLDKIEHEPHLATVKRFAVAMPNPMPDFGEIVFPLPNVWLGVSAEDQTNYDEREKHLRATPAAKRFLSLEPLLGPIFGEFGWKKFDWVIVGGESGREARPMHPDWPRSLRDQCAAADVPFFMKQWGEWLPRVGDPLDVMDLAEREFGNIRVRGNVTNGLPSRNPIHMLKVGKKRAGRLLDGVEHNGMPPLSDDGMGASPQATRHPETNQTDPPGRDSCAS